MDIDALTQAVHDQLAAIPAVSWTVPPVFSRVQLPLINFEELSPANFLCQIVDVDLLDQQVARNCLVQSDATIQLVFRQKLPDGETPEGSSANATIGNRKKTVLEARKIYTNPITRKPPNYSNANCIQTETSLFDREELEQYNIFRTVLQLTFREYTL